MNEFLACFGRLFLFPHSISINAVRHLSLGIKVFGVAATITFASDISATTARPEMTSRMRIAEHYAERPLSFEANRGQTDSRVHFLSRGQGYSLFLTPTEAVLTLRKADPQTRPELSQLLPGKTAPHKPATAAVLRMQLQGANTKAQATGLEEQPGKTNYFRGKDPKAWRTGIPSFTKVKYHGIYPGIDLVYYGKQRQLEYDFIVAPGADPKTIRLRFNGAEQLSLDSNGQLVVKTAGGEVIQHKPTFYQEIGGVRKKVAGGYVLSPVNKIIGKKARQNPEVGFRIAQYDLSAPLIIDPVLAYSTFLGGSGSETAYDIAVDGQGNAYISGTTDSTDFPIKDAQSLGSPSGPASDGFVTKFNPKGEIVWSTLLGNYYFGLPITGIAVDRYGNAYITGITVPGFPVVYPSPPVPPLKELCNNDSHVFIAKLSTDGSKFVYSTCLDGISDTTRIAVDRLGNAYVTGNARSTDFPTVNPIKTCENNQDAFVAKVNSKGTALIYSTCLGGSSSDLGSDITVDRHGNAYVTGSTASTDFPTLHPIQTCARGFSDAFVTKLNVKGTALVYSTCLGGSDDTGFGFDGGYGIAVDRFGNAYVTGHVSSTDLPTVHPVQTSCNYDAFISKLSMTGTKLIYSTCFGGPYSQGAGIALDRLGNAYVTGYTESPIFPKVHPVQPTCGGSDGSGDAFVTKFNTSGRAIIYSTCMGNSSGFEFSDYGSAIAVDRFGNAYVAGTTASPEFPTKNAFQPTLNGSSDAFVTKLSGN
jgi:hypothetical protein